jgi:hypothetical protein
MYVCAFVLILKLTRIYSRIANHDSSTSNGGKVGLCSIRGEDDDTTTPGTIQTRIRWLLLALSVLGKYDGNVNVHTQFYLVPELRIYETLTQSFLYTNISWC